MFKKLTHRKERAKNRRIEIAAKAEVEEVKSWKCRTCETIILEGQFCSSCQQYWDDVRNGVFDD